MIGKYLMFIVVVMRLYFMIGFTFPICSEKRRTCTWLLLVGSSVIPGVVAPQVTESPHVGHKSIFKHTTLAHLIVQLIFKLFLPSHSLNRLLYYTTDTHTHRYRHLLIYSLS
jgi:hypothetical protein